MKAILGPKTGGDNDSLCLEFESPPALHVAPSAPLPPPLPLLPVAAARRRHEARDSPALPKRHPVLKNLDPPQESIDWTLIGNWFNLSWVESRYISRINLSYREYFYVVHTSLY